MSEKPFQFEIGSLVFVNETGDVRNCQLRSVLARTRAINANGKHNIYQLDGEEDYMYSEDSLKPVN